MLGFHKPIGGILSWKILGSPMAQDTLGNVVASLGRHRLGNEPDEHPGAEGRAPRRPRDS